MMTNRFLQFGNPHHQLPSLANQEIFALQACQMLGSSRPRGPDQIGDILMAERHSKQRAARFLDSKIRAQFKQGYRDSLAKPEIQKARAAQQQPIPLLQIVFAQMLERRLGGFLGNAVEFIAAETPDSAIIISHALEIGLAHRQARELGNRPGREQRDRHPLVARVQAGDPRDACQQNVNFRRKRGFAQDHFASLEVGQRQRADEQCKFGSGEPGKSFEAAQAVEVSVTMTFELIQYCTFRRMLRPYAFAANKRNGVLPAEQQGSSEKNRPISARVLIKKTLAYESPRPVAS